MKCILDDPHEGWSTGKDFTWVDELVDLAVDNMVRLINSGFVFRKEMFKGGVNQNDLGGLKSGKKQKEKEPKEKKQKEHGGEATVGQSSDTGTQTFIRQEIIALEKRIYQAIEDKFEKLGASTILSQQLAFEDIDRKIGDALVRQLKTMEASLTQIISEVIGQRSSSGEVPVDDIPPQQSQQPLSPNDVRPHPPNLGIPDLPIHSTPSEAAEFRINSVLRDLDIEADVDNIAGTTHVEATIQTNEPLSPVLDVNAQSHPLSSDVAPNIGGEQVIFLSCPPNNLSLKILFVVHL